MRWRKWRLEHRDERTLWLRATSTFWMRRSAERASEARIAIAAQLPPACFHRVEYRVVREP